MLTQHRRVALHIVFTFGGCEVLYQRGVQAVVVVQHEHRQPAIDVGPYRARPAEIEILRMRVLGEDRHVMAVKAPCPCQRACVDV